MSLKTHPTDWKIPQVFFCYLLRGEYFCAPLTCFLWDLIYKLFVFLFAAHCLYFSFSHFLFWSILNSYFLTRFLLSEMTFSNSSSLQARLKFRPTSLLVVFTIFCIKKLSNFLLGSFWRAFSALFPSQEMHSSFLLLWSPVPWGLFANFSQKHLPLDLPGLMADICQDNTFALYPHYYQDAFI